MDDQDGGGRRAAADADGDVSADLDGTVTAPDGERLRVDRSDGERGSRGPFLAAYLAGDPGERWGYVCANCGTADVAVDTMGRIVCNGCENVAKPEVWDAAHE